MINSPLPPAWTEALEGFAEHLRAGQRLPTTIQLRRQHLSQLARAYPDPWTITSADLVRWTAAQNWKRATAASVQSTLRTFYRWAIKTRRVENDPTIDLPDIPSRKPNPHPLSNDMLADVLAKATPRDLLMLHLAGRCGMRRGEVARCRGEDIQGADGEWEITILGKGERPRTIPIPDDVAHAVRAHGSGWTFPSPRGGHLSEDYVGARISSLMPPGWSMHSLRHRFATRAYKESRDVYSVQGLLGHASPSTTVLYVKVPDDAMRRAMMAAS